MQKRCFTLSLFNFLPPRTQVQNLVSQLQFDFPEHRFAEKSLFDFMRKIKRVVIRDVRQSSNKKTKMERKHGDTMFTPFVACSMAV